MHGTIAIYGDLEKRFVEYCRRRKQERGKVIQSETAIRELLTKALEGVEPPKPLEERLAAIEARLTEVEARRVNH
jgi:hypothetical protein